MTDALAAIEARVSNRVSELVHPPPRFKNTAAIGKELVQSLQDEGENSGLKIGLRPLDNLMRGMRAGEIALLIGFSHSGKTQVMLHSFIENRDKRILLFTPDEMAVTVLTKLVCAHRGIVAADLEEALRAKDPEALALLHAAATVDFPNLLVVEDTPGSLNEMERVVAEATEFWGEPPDLFGFDYLELFFPREEVKEKVRKLKTFCRKHHVPGIVVHQTPRGHTGPGVAPRISSGAWGGEQEASFVIGVYRKKDDPTRAQFERDSHATTLSINLVKNKRPPNKLTSAEGVDFHFVQDTGAISPGQVKTKTKSQMALEYSNQQRRARSEK